MPDLTLLSNEAILALAYLFTLPMVYCQWAFLMVVRLMPAAIAAIGTLAVPVVGVFSSALILAEPVGWREIGAMALIVSALGTVLILPAVLSGRNKSAP